MRWNLTDPARRRDLDEIVLVEGTLDDARELINGPEVVRRWDRMYLPPWVRTAWQPFTSGGSLRMCVAPLQDLIGGRGPGFVRDHRRRWSWGIMSL